MKSQTSSGVASVATAVLGFCTGPICSSAIVAGFASLLGIGSASLVVTFEQYRWLFIAFTVIAVLLGFYLNYIRVRSHWSLQLLFWASSLVTILTVAHWGWWNIF